MSALGGAGVPGAVSQTPDCIKAVARYINKILKPSDKTKEISGMKALLVDKETKTIVSMVYTMNEILSKDVFIVEDVNASHAGMGHLKAVCLLRPTPKNIDALRAHLRAPKFSEYHIFFTNVCPGDSLRRLAEEDAAGVVKQVQEFYADYYAVNPDLFSLHIEGSLSLSRPRATHTAVEETAMKRTQQGLLALLLSMKMKPFVRYQSSSEAACKLALELTGTMSGERDLFTFNKTGAQSLLLILDRREDPVTPLLSQWTYQAMIHELVTTGIENNTVKLKGVTGITKDLEEVVLSPSQDPFFRDNMYADYGAIAASVKSALDDYSATQKIHSNVSSIEDMKRFFDSYPELRSKGLVVSKHVALLSQIASAVDSRRLLDISAIEQEITATEDAAGQARQIFDVLSAGPTDPLDALRLLMVYTLRYEKSKPDRVAEVRRFIAERARLDAETLELVDTLLAFGGAGVRAGDLFGTAGGIMGRIVSKVRSTTVAGVTSVYAQHQPYLVSVLQDLARGKIGKDHPLFPYAGPQATGTPKFNNVVVFVIGGVTYEEAAKVAAINAGLLNLTGTSGAGSPIAPPPFHVILGGTALHNSKSFLAELKRMHDGRIPMDMEVGGTGFNLR